MTRKGRSQLFIFLLCVGAIVAFHAFGYIGHYGYDDLHYAELANDFRNGKIDYNDHFSFRTPVIALTALSYSLFGISDFASALPAMLISVMILFLVLRLLKNRDNKTLITGLALTTLSGWFLFYSDKLMPDVYVALSVIAALYVIHQYRFRTKSRPVVLYSLGLSLALLFGFMSKGTIILILPLLVYYFIADMVQKKNISFWLFNILTGLAVITLYFLAVKLITGDVFKRFEAITSNSYLNLCSYDQQSFAILLKRISYQFFELIIYQGMATGFIFVIAYFLQRKAGRYFKMEDSFSFWMTSGLILLLSSNFMSISFTSYSPMCLDPRHYLFIIPVVSIPASMVINEYIETKKHKFLIISIAGIIAVLSVFLPVKYFLQQYTPLFALLVVYAFLRKSRFNQHLFVILLMVILSVRPLAMIKYAQKVDYRKQKEIFTKTVLNAQDSTLVITNDVQKRWARYFQNFKSNEPVRIINYNDFESYPADDRKKLLYLSWYTRYLSKMAIHDLPLYAQNILNGIKPVYEDEKLNLLVYDMSDFSDASQKGDVLVHSVNDFEQVYPHWNQNDGHLTRDVVYKGDAGIRVKRYSATFVYPVDSLPLDEISQLMISCNLFCNVKDKTKAEIVISIENADGTYVWNGVKINKYIKAYSNWWPVQHEISVNVGELKENSTLKIFIWNKDNQEAFIDDFDVKIFGRTD